MFPAKDTYMEKAITPDDGIAAVKSNIEQGHEKEVSLEGDDHV